MNLQFDPLVSQFPQPIRDAVVAAAQTGTWTQVRRALSAFDTCTPELQGGDVTIQLLSSYNVESIEPALRLGLRCMPCRPKLEIAPLNTIEQQILTRSSAVYTEGKFATVILWRADEMLPDLFFPVTFAGARAARRTEEVQARIKDIVQAYLQVGTRPLYLSTLPVPAAFGSVALGSQLSTGLLKTIGEVNATIFGLASLDSRVRVLDVNWWSAQEGRKYYDLQMDFIAKQPFTVSAAISLGLFLARNLRPLVVPRRKVLAVDLDNTLWGGILGEDGVHKLKLGRDFPGNVFLRLQQEIRELKHQGILLVLTSKNDEPEVRHAMELLPDMLLRWDDFACRKVNFNHKYLNLREAAAELGLALDSFALLDDSDYEREQMKALNPEVLVLNGCSDALQMLASLLTSDAFAAHLISDEDRNRHREYELRSARTVRDDGSIEEFLASLELRASLESVRDSNIERVVQMLGKTNQFNLTTRRHGLEDLRTLLSVPGSVSLTLRLADKFGDQGIVGVLLAVPIKGGGALSVDSFLVSCRALGRGVEDLLWAELLNRAHGSGVMSIHGQYLPTLKNGLVATLYDRLGLKRVVESDQGTDYLLEPIKPACFPPWITVQRSRL